MSQQFVGSRAVHGLRKSFSKYLLFDHSRVHVGNLSDGKLGGNFGRDDSLGARIREGPLNAMNRHCGVAP